MEGRFRVGWNLAAGPGKDHGQEARRDVLSWLSTYIYLMWALESDPCEAAQAVCI